MKILHIIRNLEIGGMERVVLSLACEQRSQGHHVAIAEVAQRQGTCYPDPEGIPVARLPCLWRRMREDPFDVVHAHNILALRHAWLPARLTRSRLVFTKHGMHFPSGLSRWLCARPDAMAAVSRPVYDRYLALLPGVKKRLRYVPNGVGGIQTADCRLWSAVEELPTSYRVGTLQDEEQTTKHQEPDSQGLRSAPPSFLWVGRMVPEKGLDVLLQAWEEARLEHVRLVLVGDGPERQALEEQAKHLPPGTVVCFEGMQDELERYYDDADVLVMPSRTEGLPMALLEAGSAGLPAIVTEVGEMPDIIRECGGGWMVPKENVQALATALEEAAQASRVDLLAKGEALRVLVQQKYSVTAMAAAYEGMYGKS